MFISTVKSSESQLADFTEMNKTLQQVFAVENGQQ